MPMIDSDTFKVELNAANLARETLIDHQILPKPYDRDWHQAESARLMEAYEAATNSLAHQMKKVVELAEATDIELEALRRDANRYRVLREHWLRIEGGATVHRAAGLDLWCDDRRPLAVDQEKAS